MDVTRVSQHNHPISAQGLVLKFKLYNKKRQQNAVSFKGFIKVEELSLRRLASTHKGLWIFRFTPCI